MSSRDLLKLPRLRSHSADGEDTVAQSATAGAARAEMIQRLQVGLSGLAGMILLVGLANIIQDRARVADELAVPEAAPTVEPAGNSAQRDPLADAGVVPDLPAEPAPASQSPAILPEQGNGDTATTP